MSPLRLSQEAEKEALEKKILKNREMIFKLQIENQELNQQVYFIDAEIESDKDLIKRVFSLNK